MNLTSLMNLISEFIFKGPDKRLKSFFVEIGLAGVINLKTYISLKKLFYRGQ